GPGRATVSRWPPMVGSRPGDWPRDLLDRTLGGSSLPNKALPRRAGQWSYGAGRRVGVGCCVVLRPYERSKPVMRHGLRNLIALGSALACLMGGVAVAQDKSADKPADTMDGMPERLQAA